MIFINKRTGKLFELEEHKYYCSYIWLMGDKKVFPISKDKFSDEYEFIGYIYGL